MYSPVEEVGGGVVSLDRSAALAMDCEIYGVTNCRNIAFDLVSDRGADLLGAGNWEIIKCSGVTFLSAHFGKEDSFVGDDEIAVNFENDCLAGVFFESKEFGGNIGRNLSRTDYCFLLRSSGEFAGFFHVDFDRFFIERDAPLTTKKSGKIEWETIGVVELEGILRREDVFTSGLLELFHSPVEGFIERLFFKGEGFFNDFSAGFDFGEDVAEFLNECIDESREERFVAIEAEGAAVFDSAA